MSINQFPTPNLHGTSAYSRSRKGSPFLPYNTSERDHGGRRSLRRPPLFFRGLLGLLAAAGILYWLLPAYLISYPSNSGKTEVASLACTPPAGLPPKQYALILDAGSTGSRIHVYIFNHCNGVNPTLENEVFHHVEPGLSSPTFTTPEQAANSLDPLLQVALSNVPKNVQKCTPITVKATAGLRMLKGGKGDLILAAVKSKLQKQYPFALAGPNAVEIMAGKDEGVFAWITVNYLLKRIGEKVRMPTAAIMDLGGGSTQIVFEPRPSTPLEPGDHKYELEFGNHTYILYQHSYDGYGLMQGRRRLKDASVANKRWPCYALGHTDEYLDDDGLTHDVTGSAQGHKECHRFIETNLFDKQKCPADYISRQSCSFDGVYQPSLTASFADNDIYAFSYFYDKFAEPFGMVSDLGFSVGQLRDAAEKVCAGKMSPDEMDGPAGRTATKLFADPEWCTDLGFMYGLLSVGYEIPDDRILKTAKKIGGVETGWCLGAALNILDGWGTDGHALCVKEVPF
ncbi:nucleoside phosphatase family-domain-containing protein [Phlyctochytrium arcticum]|nr:nucleoside phosphatase family-domain-containing protein [Phlyctochytrium arcticum]